MDAHTLLKQYADGKRDFSWADLRAADLTDAKLPAINLYGANLSGATLIRVDFSGANLRKVNLTRANLTNTNLTKANLRGADLTDAVLAGALLDEAVLTTAILPDGSRVEPPIPQARLPVPQLEIEVAAPVAETPIPIASPSPATRPGAIADLRQLPWASLLFLAGGYGCFGAMLVLQQAPPHLWFLVLAASLLWTVAEDFFWFLGLIAALLVISGFGISIIALVAAAASALALFVTFKLILGWSWRESMRSSLWVSAIATVMLTLAAWLFTGADAFSGGGIVLSLSTLHLAALLIAGIAGVSLGGVAPAQMQSAHLSRRHTLLIFGATVIAGLAAGAFATRFF